MAEDTRSVPRFALVELYVETAGHSGGAAPDAVLSAIVSNPAARQEAVESVLGAIASDARAKGVHWVLFPGWTMVGTSIPWKALDALPRASLVLELVPPGFGNSAGVKHKQRGVRSGAKARATRESKNEGKGGVPEFYVLRRGKVVSGPHVQRIAYSDDAWDGDMPSQRASQFADDLRNGRGFDLGGEKRGSLWICGEVNALYQEGLRFYPAPTHLPTRWDVVFNPSHTRAGPQRVRNKRLHLSKKGLLLCTANIHGQWIDSSKNSTGRRSHVAQEIYRNGRRVGPRHTISVEGGHRIHLI